MCTVTRPGLAAIASMTAVELMVSVLQHPDGYDSLVSQWGERRSLTPLEIEFMPLLLQLQQIPQMWTKKGLRHIRVSWVSSRIPCVGSLGSGKHCRLSGRHMRSVRDVARRWVYTVIIGICLTLYELLGSTCIWRARICNVNPGIQWLQVSRISNRTW